MKIEVLFFAELKEIFGPFRPLEVADGARITDIINRLALEASDLERRRNTLRYAVNERFETSDSVLRAGDRLAILLPMSGG